MAAIENSVQLKKHIMELKYKAYEYEEEIGHELKELSYQMHPSNILHRWLNDLKGDSQLRGDMLSIGKSAALNLALNAILGRGTIKRTVLLMIVKKVFSLIIRKKEKQKELSLN